MLRIVPYCHPALRYESRPVARIDDTLRSQVREMFALMYASKGIGLAANQVALPYRLFVLNTSADAEKPELERVYVNPEIIKRHGQVEDEEGCLSFPGLYADVKRAKRIKVRYYDLDGVEHLDDAEDLLSRAVQHEGDHLAGKLFIDHLGPAATKVVAARVRGFEESFRQAQVAGEYPDDAEIVRRLDALRDDWG